MMCSANEESANYLVFRPNEVEITEHPVHLGPYEVTVANYLNPST